MDNEGNKLTERGERDEGDAPGPGTDKWGCAVCFGTVITFIAGIGHVNSFGLIYNDFITDTRSTAKSLTAAHGVFAVMLAVGGIILNIISKRFSLRLGGTIGACIMLTGSFSTILISNTNQLLLTFGVFQGIGFGMMVPVCYSTLNHYFTKRRTTIMSICKAIQGIILIWYPHLLKKILSVYGFRGTLLVISGISLHTLSGMAVMITNAKKSTKKIKTANNIENGKDKSENIDLLIRTENNEVVQENDNADNIRGGNKIWQELLDILNVSVLRDPVFCNICIGQSFVNFSDLTFFVFQPMLLFQYGYNTVKFFDSLLPLDWLLSIKAQVAMCISICAGADVAGRCALALLSSLVPINTRLLFYVATVFTLLFRIVILQVQQFIWVAIVTAVLGILRALLHVASPLVISNHVSHQDFPGAYALFMLATGLVNVVFAPLIGLLKDVYQDYVPAFYALTLCCVPCLLSWPFEYSLKNKRDNA